MAGQKIMRGHKATVAAAGGPDAIIARIASGTPLLHIARELGIPRSSLAMVITLRPEHREALARARTAAASALAVEALSIADEAQPGLERVADLQIRHRQWMAERMNSTDWGTRQPGVEIQIGSLHLAALRHPESSDRELPPAA